MTGAVAACGLSLFEANWGNFSGNSNANVTMKSTAVLTATWAGTTLDDMTAECSSSGTQNLFTSGSTFSVVTGETVHFQKGGGGDGVTVTISENGRAVDTFVT